jgi:hypothetical protein
MQKLVNRLLPSTSFDALRQIAKTSKETPYDKKILWNGVSYAGYAYGLLHGCRLAQKLGINHVSAIELGVAGGNGLLALERHSRTIEKHTGVSVDVIGMDTGAGLPSPKDYRDIPYFFSDGDFRMKEASLRERLTKARLILGDVCSTFQDVIAEEDLAPIAFISFDMDYYHPTKAVLDQLAAKENEKKLVPRTFMYFDNTVGNSEVLYNEFAGELLAISEFNSEHVQAKIVKDRSFLAHILNFAWYHKIYILHQFAHELYGVNVGNQGPDALSLKS